MWTWFLQPVTHQNDIRKADDELQKRLDAFQGMIRVQEVSLDSRDPGNEVEAPQRQSQPEPAEASAAAAAHSSDAKPQSASKSLAAKKVPKDFPVFMLRNMFAFSFSQPGSAKGVKHAKRCIQQATLDHLIAFINFEVRTNE